MDNQSIQHTRWNCTYHIVFIPKYRRKVMYGEVKRDVVEVLKKLCEMKQVQILLSRKLNDALSSRLFYAHFDSHRDISHFKSSCFCELFF